VDKLNAEKYEAVAQDPRDTYFFVTAMDIAANKLNDLSLGEAIRALSLHGRNRDFIGDSYKESIF
jgi:pentatricopeptide repeat domain-containing protein 3